MPERLVSVNTETGRSRSSNSYLSEGVCRDVLSVQTLVHVHKLGSHSRSPSTILYLAVGYVNHVHYPGRLTWVKRSDSCTDSLLSRESCPVKVCEKNSAFLKICPPEQDQAVGKCSKSTKEFALVSRSHNLRKWKSSRPRYEPVSPIVKV